MSDENERLRRVLGEARALYRAPDSGALRHRLGVVLREAEGIEDLRIEARAKTGSSYENHRGVKP